VPSKGLAEVASQVRVLTSPLEEHKASYAVTVNGRLGREWAQVQLLPRPLGERLAFLSSVQRPGVSPSTKYTHMPPGFLATADSEWAGEKGKPPQCHASFVAEATKLLVRTDP